MRRPLLVDVLLAALFTGLTLATLYGWSTGPPSVALIVLAVLSVAPIALRQVAPVLTLAVIAAALGVAGLVGGEGFPSGGIGLLVAMFSVAMLRPRSVAALCLGATVALLMVTWVAQRDEMAWPQVMQSGLVLVGAWALGEATRRWSRRAELAAAEAARAVAEERVRIARELHDVVAHHMSVITLQAGLAEFVVDTDPPTAKAAMATVGDAGRDAMLEMRRLLDVLRIDHDDEADLRPQPGLELLPDLVARMRDAGLAIELAVTGESRPLPPGPDLCAYRTVQESLTNVLKHAGPDAQARVALDYGEDTLTMRISDDGVGGSFQAGHGIRGMRERAALYGGVLSAGPAITGFEVLLRLPA
ncbi:sensor histidine kinase [Paractinoplanes lichenicola]|uniref:histidine kinase n=1 Tax=Paractinoplanes lichenicola TaxID=2802976 RepID=A0ABS1VN29_9ACTN|nr:histidine kinase [Actinoplanes lichenicola]MBL7256136.1 sensor histidine kinase [Actinoplanes lichenicola]